MNKVLFGVIAVLAFGTWWFWDEAQQLSAEKATQECIADVATDTNEGNEKVRQAQREADKRAIAQLEAEIRRLQRQNREAMERADRLEKQRQAQRARLEELKHDDPSVDEFVSTPVPDSYSHWLQLRPEGDHPDEDGDRDAVQDPPGGGGEPAPL